MNTQHVSRSVSAHSLRIAANAIDALRADKVKVLGHYHNGRQPVLLCDRKPPRIAGVVKRSQPSDTGIDRVYACPYQGVQLEWNEHIPAVREVGHG